MSDARWYVLHTYSGYENKVADNIKTLVKNGKLEHLIEEVKVPTETITEKVKKKVTETGSDGVKVQVEKTVDKETELKLYPSYVYVKMVMTDESWYICRNTRGVTGFVGPGSKPIPLTDEEVANLGEAKSVKDVTFAPGELVTITAGIFEDSEGTIKEVDEKNKRVTVSVQAFGRETRLEMALSDIKKI